MRAPDLHQLESQARRRDLLLRLNVTKVAGLVWTLRVGVARRQNTGSPTPQGPASLVLLGELKGWALPSHGGLRLDTMRVQGGSGSTADVGLLIWAATFAWAQEATPCRQATLLAIRDNDSQHRRLVRYFRRLGFAPLRELGAGPLDLAPRLLWGGAGLLMRGDVNEGLARAWRQLQSPA
ncbi:MAG: hypothetical protein KGO47_09060 [Cyanobacteria bacterium REEB417]|nr:hypothetical protein [Cyanobacteria bacterium REEB417]